MVTSLYNIRYPSLQFDSLGCRRLSSSKLYYYYTVWQQEHEASNKKVKSGAKYQCFLQGSISKVCLTTAAQSFFTCYSCIIEEALTFTSLSITSTLIRTFGSYTYVIGRNYLTYPGFSFRTCSQRTIMACPSTVTMAQAIFGLAFSLSRAHIWTYMCWGWSRRRRWRWRWHCWWFSCWQ